MSRHPLLLGLLLLALAGSRTGLRGQVSDGVSTTPLVGRVVDADGGYPLAEAEVSLFRIPDGTTVTDELLDDPASMGRRVGDVSTGPDGNYRFDDLPGGSYILRVERLGYRTTTLHVRAFGVRSRVSVGLRVEPIALEPLTVRGSGEIETKNASGERMALGRVPAVHLRQELLLASDARMVSAPDLRESASLGERDIFRTLQRLPGVATRDDYSAELWTRGASWGETRVYLDGVPLFNPVHGFGVLSGMSYHGLGTAYFHPGARPVDLPEASAARLDLESRSGLGTPGTQAGVEVSLASGHAWGRGSLQDGRGGWMVASRRSYVDVVARQVSDRPDEQLPYVFSDVLGRLDLEVGSETSLEVSGLWESDAMRDEIADQIQGASATWGNAVGQATLTFPLSGWTAQQSVGGTVYRAVVDSFPSRFDDTYSAPGEHPADHRVVYALLRGKVSDGGDAGWEGGYDLVHQSVRYEGPEPWPYSRRPPDLRPTEEKGALTRFGVWGRRRWAPEERIEVEGGLRADVGGDVAGGTIQLQPTVMARVHVTPRATVTAGAGRYVQYTQSPAPVGPRLERSLETGRMWMLAGPDRPPLTSRIVTLGGEVWLGPEWLLSATGYHRTSRGVVLPDATPGLVVQRSPLVEGRLRARGIDVSLRRLAGRVTGSVAYSLGDARAEAAGLEFPAPTDRRHVVDLTMEARLTPGLSLAAAWVLATGAPYTRTLDRCVGDDCRPAAWLDRPFRRRSSAYRSLDLVLDWTHRFGSWSLGGFLQARNVLGHDNAVTYTNTEESCIGGIYENGRCSNGGQPSFRDAFTPGIPTIPLLGLRVTF